MNISSRSKFGLILLFISIFFSFALFLKKTSDSKDELISTTKNESSDPIVDKSNYENLNKAFVSIAPTPIANQQGRVKGKTSPVKFEKDLETSLKIQQVPTLWLEYTNENNQLIKVEPPEKAQEFIRKRWFRTLQYSYQNQSTNNREAQLDINKNYLNDTAVYATTIADFEVITPLEKRNISREEAFQMMKIVAELAIDRYKELQNISLQINSQKIYK